MQLPRKGKLCIITSSIKDVMVFKQHGFPAICFNGESYGINKDSESGKTVASTINILKKRYSYLLLFLDNDDPGVKASIKLQQMHHVPYTVSPAKELKDISDYQKKYGPQKTFRTIKKLISKQFRHDGLPY